MGGPGLPTPLQKNSARRPDSRRSPLLDLAADGPLLVKSLILESVRFQELFFVKQFGVFEKLNFFKKRTRAQRAPNGKKGCFSAMYRFFWKSKDLQFEFAVCLALGL